MGDQLLARLVVQRLRPGGALNIFVNKWRAGEITPADLDIALGRILIEEASRENDQPRRPLNVRDADELFVMSRVGQSLQQRTGWRVDLEHPGVLMVSIEPRTVVHHGPWNLKPLIVIGTVNGTWQMDLYKQGTSFENGAAPDETFDLEEPHESTDVRGLVNAIEAGITQGWMKEGYIK